MAIRAIREHGDAVLTKRCKDVTKMSNRTKVLIEDMIDTMLDSGGVGLAAPQVGVLKRICVIDVSGCQERDEENAMSEAAEMASKTAEKTSEVADTVPETAGMASKVAEAAGTAEKISKAVDKATVQSEQGEANQTEEEHEVEPELLVLINPEIIATSGSQSGDEACLSLPGLSGVVTRPLVVTVRALDEDLQTIEVTGEGLLARALCHEIDHLAGEMYMAKVEGELRSSEQEDEV